MTIPTASERHVVQMRKNIVQSTPVTIAKPSFITLLLFSGYPIIYSSVSFKISPAISAGVLPSVATFKSHACA